MPAYIPRFQTGALRITTRNIVVHQYDEVDLAIIWKILQEGFPELLAHLEQLLEKEEAAATQSSRQLWDRYSQGIADPIDGQKMIEIARRAFQDNLDAETIAQMLREAPHFQQVQRSQGPEQAREFIRLLVQRAQIQNQLPPEPPHRQERKRGLGPQI